MGHKKTHNITDTMASKLTLTVAALVVLFASQASAQVFDITKNGAQPNGDATQALLATWSQACASATKSKVVVPSGIFKVSGALLKGPCKAPIEFNLQGTLQAPAVGGAGYKSGDTWIVFEYLDHLTVSGSGIFDGQGKSAWGKKCDHTQYCGSLPINVRFDYVTNSVIQDVTTKDSKQFHTNVLGCRNVTFQNYKVVAPGDSVNTDGIHIGRSEDIKIIDTNIATGDDCVSIGDGSKKITLKGVHCGPGHELSIVLFKGIRGTSKLPLAVNLVCSSAAPCSNVQLQDINLKYAGGAITSNCKNIKPLTSGVQIPPPCMTTA